MTEVGGVAAKDMVASYKTFREDVSIQWLDDVAPDVREALEAFMKSWSRARRMVWLLGVEIFYPCPGRKNEKWPGPDEFANFLENIFASETRFESPNLKSLVRDMKTTGFRDIERFAMVELQDALKHLRRNKCADSNGIVAECFAHGSLELHEHLLRIFNLMLVDGHVEERWKQTTFSMIPKTGDPTNPGNWRPLAILNITCKIFSRMVYKRVKPILEAQQSKDQIGFRSSVGVDDAFAVFENVCSKSMEWSVPMWCANFDLRKAFDRIEYNALFDALKVQGLPYLKLMASLYHDQVGLVQGRQFPIKRGVKQGDVLSPLLFNAGLEHAMRKWKLRIQHCGLHCGHNELLTNVRYADDLMLYARSDTDLASMVERLVEELAAVG